MDFNEYLVEKLVGIRLRELDAVLDWSQTAPARAIRTRRSARRVLGMALILAACASVGSADAHGVLPTDRRYIRHLPLVSRSPARPRQRERGPDMPPQ
jgi:hypothetical protein